MTSAQTQFNPALSIAEYLAFEEKSLSKHEYAVGQIFPMAGASERHNRIGGNVFARLHAASKGGPRTPYISDMRVKIDQVIYYPDVMVSCDTEDRDPYLKSNPCLIIEVLSPSTERIDRGEKLYNYRQIAALQAYVLVSQDATRVDVYRRADGLWLFETYTELSDVISFECLDTQVSLAEIYERIEFPNAEVAYAVPTN
jgi:Uma2 family endonuclease